MQEPVCCKCQSPMERGWILDSGHSSSFQSSWVEGEPRGSLFGVFTGGKSASGKVRRSIDAYRCSQCGYLEFYAIQEDNGRLA